MGHLSLAYGDPEAEQDDGSNSNKSVLGSSEAREGDRRPAGQALCARRESSVSPPRKRAASSQLSQ